MAGERTCDMRLESSRDARGNLDIALIRFYILVVPVWNPNDKSSVNKKSVGSFVCYCTNVMKPPNDR